MAAAPHTIACPACKKRFKGKPELVGKRIKCPACAEPFVVPADEAAPVPAKVEKSPAPIAMTPMVEEATYGLEQYDESPKCPNCAQPMLDKEAIVCVYCGYNTLTRVYGKTKKLVQLTRAEHLKYLTPAIVAATIFFLILICLFVLNLIVPPMVENTKADWVASEALRMWTTMLMVALLWALAVFTFKRMVMAPRPPDVEKE